MRDVKREKERETEGGVERHTVDNNNYYTRRSFANAVLRRKGVEVREGRQGGLLDEVSAGETLRCPLSRPVRSGRREKGKR
jgi:hypothetical protein